MRLISDERAYRRVLGNFVGCRSSACDFISRFSHLWHCDGAPLGACDAGTSSAASSAHGFYGLMDSINALCEDYSSSLADGCGYRVSEEQFRKEIEALMREGSHPARKRAG